MKFKFFQEFKEFAIKGNMIDIAIGVIIGSAFNKVVDVLVKEVFLPPLSLLTDGTNWQNKKLILRKATVSNGITKPEEIALGYGKLFEASVDFLIITMTVFLIVKIMNALRKKGDDPKDASSPTPKNLVLLDRIGDLMEQQNEMIEKNLRKSDKTK